MTSKRVSKRARKNQRIKLKLAVMGPRGWGRNAYSQGFESGSHVAQFRNISRDDVLYFLFVLHAFALGL